MYIHPSTKGHLTIHVSGQAQRTRGITEILVHFASIERVRHALLQIKRLRRLPVRLRFLGDGPRFDDGGGGFLRRHLRTRPLTVAALKHPRRQPGRHHGGIARAGHGAGDAPSARVARIAITLAGEGAARR